MSVVRGILPVGGTRLFLGAVAAAAAVRVFLLWQYYCISSDGVRYIAAAKNLYAGSIAGGLSSVYPPGYPLLIAALFPLVGDWELAGQLLSLFFGVVLLGPLYLLFRDVYDEKIAAIGCFFAAISPFLARYSVHVRSESAFLFFSSLTLLLFYRGFAKRALRVFFFGGLAGGFAYLVRPEALGLLVLVPGFFALRWWLKMEHDPSWMVKSAAVFVAAFMLCAMPYIIYLSIDTGRWGAVSRKAGITLAFSLQESGLFESAEGGDAADLKSVGFVDFVARHPVQYFRKVIGDVLPAVGIFFEALHFPYVPFLLAGLYLVFRARFWQRKDLLLLAFFGFYLFAFTLILVNRRYSLQVVPVSLGWAAMGALWSVQYCRDRFSANTAKIILMVLFAAFLGGTLPKTLTPISMEKAHVRNAGWFLKERRGSETLRVAVFDDRITFYADATPVLLYGTKEPDMPAKLREGRADYLAVDFRTWQSFFPEVASEPARFGLLLEKEMIGTRNDRLLIFRVVQAR